MLPPVSYQPQPSNPDFHGWVARYGRWELWWGGRNIAVVQPSRGGASVILDCRKFYQEKEVWAASIAQGKRYAERWCAARLYPEVPLREAVARLTDSTPIQLPPPLPCLPPTREQQQQARRLAGAGAKEVERIKAVLEPRKPPAMIKPRAKDSMKAWIANGLRRNPIRG
ncbi:hypothetical protein [Stenotrophomonas maltophilia]|uniref:hypothetical protein n=1 Tax=Stenotrophomonas maltophilia TaxID=40324 RepID=UPI003D188870